MIRWKAKLTSLWARNCTTIWQVLILKFAFGPEKLPGLLRKGSLVLLSFMRDKENSGLTWEWILLTRSLHYREFSTVRVGIVQSSLQDQYKYPQQSNQYHGHTYIHTYFIGSSPRGFSESILHYKIINQVHDNKNITMIKEDKGQ